MHSLLVPAFPSATEGSLIVIAGRPLLGSPTTKLPKASVETVLAPKLTGAVVLVDVRVTPVLLGLEAQVKPRNRLMMKTPLFELVSRSPETKLPVTV